MQRVSFTMLSLESGKETCHADGRSEPGVGGRGFYAYNNNLARSRYGTTLNGFLRERGIEGL